VDEKALNRFLKDEYQNPNWSVGVHINYLKDIWRDMITLVKQYITCEGRFSHVFRFHMHFLLHLSGMSKMNLPYFLFSSLAKMSRKV